MIHKAIWTEFFFIFFYIYIKCYCKDLYFYQISILSVIFVFVIKNKNSSGKGEVGWRWSSNCPLSAQYSWNFRFLRISQNCIYYIVLYIINVCVSVWVESVEKLRGWGPQHLNWSTHRYSTAKDPDCSSSHHRFFYHYWSITRYKDDDTESLKNENLDYSSNLIIFSLYPFSAFSEKT